MALTTRHPAPGLIHHADRGSQYTSSVYGELLIAHQVRRSVEQTGTCCDNSVPERFLCDIEYRADPTDLDAATRSAPVWRSSRTRAESSAQTDHCQPSANA